MNALFYPDSGACLAVFFVDPLLISRIVWEMFWVGRLPLSDRKHPDGSPDSRCLSLETSLIFSNTRLFILSRLIVRSWVQFGELADCCFYYYVSFVQQYSSRLDSLRNFERVNIEWRTLLS